jgi:hypothetical protein
MLKSQLLSIISKIRMGATSPTNISDSLEALVVNPPYGATSITTTLPTLLAQGEQVIYRDPNGVQSLWIGNVNNEAWPSVGYKEWSGRLESLSGVLSVTTKTNQISGISWDISNGYAEATFSPQGRQRYILTPVAGQYVLGNNSAYADQAETGCAITVINNDEGEPLPTWSLDVVIQLLP